MVEPFDQRACAELRQFFRDLPGILATMSSSRLSSIGPVSSPSSIRMMVTPLTSSPARIARWIGAAPRQRGRSEAWTLTQPALGASRIALRKDQPVGGDDGEIGVERAEAALLFGSPAASRRPHLDPELLRPLVNRRLALRLAAAGRPRRLRNRPRRPRGRPRPAP